MVYTTVHHRFQLLNRFGFVAGFSNKADAFASGKRRAEENLDSTPYAVYDVMAKFGAPQTWNLVNWAWRVVQYRKS